MSDIESTSDAKLAVRVPSKLLARVDAAARRRGVRRSSFIRQALESESSAVLGAADAAVEPSLYDVLQEAGVLGRFTGPPDLSTTPREVLREMIAARHRSTSPAIERRRRDSARRARAR